MDEIEKYSAQGIEFYQNGHYEQAIEYFIKVKNIMETIYEENPNHPDLATTYNNLGALYIALGDFDTALSFLLKDKDIMETIHKENPNHPLLATTYNNLGALYQAKGDFDTALLYSVKAKDIMETIYEENPNHPSLATTYNNLGLLYQAKGDFDKALLYYLKAKDIRETIHKENPNHPDLAMSYGNLGLLYKAKGDFDTALSFLLKAKDIMETIYEESPNHPDLAISYGNLGTLYKALGDFDTALSYSLIAKDIMETIYEENPNHPNLATSYGNLGTLYKALGDFDTALSYSLIAKDIMETIYKENPNHPNLATSYDNLGGLYQALGDLDFALEYQIKAKDIRETIYKENPNHSDLAMSYNNLGTLYKDQGDIKNYYTYIQKSFKIYIHNRKENFAHLSLQQKYRYNKDNIHNLEFLFDSSNLYIKELQEDRDKNASEIEDVKQKVLTNWLRYKGSISDFENIITILYNDTDDNEIKKRIEKREQLQKELSSIYHTKKDDPDEQKREIGISSKLEKEITDIENTLANSSKLLSQEKLLEKVDHLMLSEYLKKDQLYVDYAYVKDSYYIFSLNHKREIEFIKVDDLISKEINSAIRVYTDLIKKQTDMNYNIKREDKLDTKEALHTLYSLLIEPYKSILFTKEYTSYIFSPDGALNLIPFDALYDKGHYLIETKDIIYTPSGKEFVRLKQNEINDSEDITIFANPNFDKKIEITENNENDNKENNKNRSIRSISDICELGDRPFLELTGTKRELEAIKEKMYSSTIFSYEEDTADKQTFLKVSDTKILHCATHAFYLDCPTTENPLLKTGIAFSGANIINDDGSRPHVATGLEIASMKLKGTELVVLSTCDSAIGDIEHSEGILGLNKAFIQAGVKTVVASLWKASDRYTADFFTLTYDLIDKELGRKMKELDSTPIDYAKLIRETKLEFIKNDNHPLFWAGFIVVG